MDRAATTSTDIEPRASREAWTLAPAVAFARVPSGAWLLDLDHGFYALDVAGANLLDRAMRLGPDQSALQLAQDQGISPAQGRQDLETLKQSLASLGLLAGTARRPCRFRRGLAVLVAFAARIAAGFWASHPHATARLVLAMAWAAIRLEGFATTFHRWQAQARLTVAPRPDLADAIDQAIRRVSCSYLLPPCACKERAIASAFLLRGSAGVIPRVVVAARPSPFTAHTWAETGGRVIGDDPEHGSRFLRIAMLDADHEGVFYA